jgi:gliding motility-associated-like protein
MKMKKTFALLFIILFSSLLGISQPANDDCTGAISLGTLPAPAACPGTGLGAQLGPIAGTIVGATPEATYIYQTNCTGAGGTIQAFPANDVWYSFVASGYQLVVSINSTFANPNIAMYAGSCASLGGGVGGCAVGAGGTVSLTVEQMVIGTTYYLQISGDVGQSGTFNMTIQNNQDCADCLTGSTLTATPPPVNGAYNPGQTVNFCFHVSTWYTVNTNWLHGVQLVFGSGWNASSLTTTPPATLQTSGGVWAYYPGGCTSTATGVTFGPGFYFDGSVIDGNPGNNFGDLNPTTNVGAGDWNFCFTITTAAGCNPGSDLSVTITTSGDGESGSWSSLGCADDPMTMFNAVGACCPPTMTSTATTCAGNDGTATATPVGSTGPYDYTWTDSGGNVVSTTTGVAGANTATGLAPGTYTVSIVNSFNCAATNTVVVANGGTPPAVPTASSNSPICSGATLNLTAATIAGGSYTWSGPSGFTSGLQNPTIPGATPAINGTYTVTVSVGGCTNTSSTIVTVNNNPTVSVSASANPICIGTSTTLTASGATTYNWSGGLGTANPLTVTPAATTTYTVTGTTSGCTGTATITININPNLVVSISASVNPVCAGTPTTLTASGGTTYTWSGGLGTANPLTVTPVTTTTYTVTGTSAGCTGTASITINVNPNLTVNISASVNPICAGTSTNLTATGGTTYTWSGGLGTANPLTVTPAATTTYTVTGTSAGCTGTANITVNVNPNPTVSISASLNPICTGTSTDLTASGATSYLWSGGLGTANPLTVTPATTTTYTVTGTTTGCTGTATITINVNPNPVVSISASANPICNGTSTNLTASGAATYSWSGGLGAANPLTVTPATTTTYTVTGTTSGCTGTATITINVNPNPVVSISVSSNPICAGTSTNLTASGATTYSWSGGLGVANPLTVTPATTTTYTVTGTTTGCTGTATITINVNPNPVVSISPSANPICMGTSTDLTASGATTYSWSGGLGSANPLTVTPATTTIYTVTGTTAGCTGTASITITVNSNPVLSVTPNAPSICPGASVALTASSTNLGTSFTWSPGTGLSSTTGATVTANPTTTQTYTVSGTDGNGCTGSTTITVTVDPISATAVSTNENCGQANGTATVTAFGNCPAGFTYQWSTIPVQTTFTAINLPQGTYTVSVYCGACVTTATATIMNLAGPSVSISGVTNTICSQANGGASATGTGGNQPYTYVWSNGQGGQNLTNVLAGNYDVTITDVNGCEATNTVNITDSPGPTASISGLTNAACGYSDGSATVMPNGGSPPYSYNWNNGTASQTLLNVPTGLYTVTITDANGCTTTLSANVGEDPGPTATAASTNEICDQANGTATVNATGGVSTSYTYLWSDGQTTATATGLVQGSYTVTVSDGGCSTVEMVDVLETPGPDAGFSAHPQVLTIMDGPVSFLDNSGGNVVAWDWNFGDGSGNGIGNELIHLYENIGTFLVTLIVTDNNGCMDTVSDTIKVKEIFTLYIPNTFTPNGDGINDLWAPKGLSVDPDNFDMYIFDRWGNVMFHTSLWYSLLNTSEPWNGTINNEGTFNDIVMDVYVYRIRLKEIDGPKHEYIGRISLIP